LVLSRGLAEGGFGMAVLGNAVVRRGGDTSRVLEEEPTLVEAWVRREVLILETSIYSKGGGRTRIEIEIGVDDLAAAITESALDYPGSAGTVLNAVAAAIRQLTERSQRVRAHVLGASTALLQVADHVENNHGRYKEPGERNEWMMGLVATITEHLDAAHEIIVGELDETDD
jgi:hypothetical protein